MMLPIIPKCGTILLKSNYPHACHCLSSACLLRTFHFPASFLLREELIKRLQTKQERGNTKQFCQYPPSPRISWEGIVPYQLINAPFGIGSAAIFGCEH